MILVKLGPYLVFFAAWFRKLDKSRPGRAGKGHSSPFAPRGQARRLCISEKFLSLSHACTMRRREEEPVGGRFPPNSSSTTAGAIAAEKEGMKR